MTPFHAIDTDWQWDHRFYHRFAPLDTIVAAGANVINVHHATPINPYINYPFIAHRRDEGVHRLRAPARARREDLRHRARALEPRVRDRSRCAASGTRSTRRARAAGTRGCRSTCATTTSPAWFVPELKDAAVLNGGMSRWLNYYVEGINWLVRNVGIDGLYLDDVAFDRTTMKRVKRMLVQEGRPGIVDLHSANQYNERDGYINSAMLYLEHFPYLNRLWFGEYFDYEKNSARLLPHGDQRHPVRAHGRDAAGRRQSVARDGLRHDQPHAVVGERRPAPALEAVGRFRHEGIAHVRLLVAERPGDDGARRRARDRVPARGAFARRGRELGAGVGDGASRAWTGRRSGSTPRRHDSTCPRFAGSSRRARSRRATGSSSRRGRGCCSW